ncbi:MAG: chorismate mutase [Candidatus Neomarinimicrobiota bacterium]|nr:chorismate mutase [Candidatus Neomarinimicrobiota bacterium]
MRKEIDDIDSKILQLIEQRMKVVCEVGDLKKDLEISVEDLNREKEIIQRLTSNSSKNLTEKQLIRIFSAVFKSSKQIQRDNK